MIRKAGFTVEQGLDFLKSCGLDSIPGGGAEIFDEEVRQKICRNKTSSKLWLSIHKAAHQAGIPSNASMLYGHVETVRHRIEHLDRLRRLQDETGGFNAFIPLKYKSANNLMSAVGEVSDIDVMKTFALSRIYLDNIPHIKAYWPMLGKDTAQLALHFGADDMDGTINDSTKIYSMAGSEELSPAMTTDEMLALIAEAGFEAVERDSLYNNMVYGLGFRV
jgi:aminodeoxyfutalosine synthase